MTQKSTGQTAYSTMYYRDAPAAMAWLQKAFGFEQQFVVPGPDGRITHAQLSFRGALIMMGSAKENPFGMILPSQAGGITQSVYLVLDDVAALYERAKAAGAVMLRDLEETDYGSLDFSARDPEGHVWHFGTYRPESAA